MSTALGSLSMETGHSETGTPHRRVLLRAATAPLPLEESQSGVDASCGEHLEVQGFDDLDKLTWTMVIWRVALVILYLAIGIVIGRCHDWSTSFSLYWAVETFTTVGYGDFTFKDASLGMHLSVAFFVLFGMIVWGAALTFLFSAVYEWERSQLDSIHARIKSPAELDFDAAAGLLASQSRLRWNLLQCLCASFSALAIGAVIVGAIEHWEWHKSFYWACVTFTSVGYGDVVPTSTFSRLVAVALMIIGVIVIGVCAGYLSGYTSSMRELRIRQRVLTQFGTELMPAELEALARGEEVRQLGLSKSENCITRAEFCLYMLVKLGVVDEEQLKASQRAFDILDVTRTGELDRRDLLLHERLASASAQLPGVRSS